ncbi:unnamed protein product [Clonostachys byssicola]|uniref:Uncharacterized protein n=1 Tax=Clonostachys byssicola TaxID=160290 RepID=A0A9N9U348_9HYPO|nr:unnamed protein product [Clonostachys byssicola]
MHFIRTVVSLFALSSFAAAQYAEDEHAGLSRRQLAEAREDFLAARDEYLAARDEYIEKRDLFRRGPLYGKCGIVLNPKPSSLPATKPPGVKVEDLICVSGRNNPIDQKKPPKV